MLGKTHVAIGVSTYTTVCLGVSAMTDMAISVPLFVSGISAAAVGSLLPDIDTPHSLLGRVVPSVSRLIERVFSHRTITHSFLFVLLFVALAFLIPSHFTTVLAIAVFLHIVVDSFSRMGVLWWYPFEKWHTYKSGGRYKKGRPYGSGYYVGGSFEKGVSVLAILVGIVTFGGLIVRYVA